MKKHCYKSQSRKIKTTSLSLLRYLCGIISPYW